MKSIRIKNLRCLEDTGYVPIKDITILVGANSSGKSTFLRTFPLFKQGLNVKKKGPILWFGDYVDFGDFQTSVRTGNDNLTFEFNIFTKKEDLFIPYFRRYYNTENFSNKEIKLSIDISSIKTYEYISKLSISCFDYVIEITTDKDKHVNEILINGCSFYSDITTYFNINLHSLNEDLFELNLESKSDLLEEQYNYRNDVHALFTDIAICNIRNIIGKKKGKVKLLKLLQNLELTNREKTIEALKNTNISAKWDKHKDVIDENSEFYIKMIQSIALFNFVGLFDLVNTSVSNIFRGVYYIAPLRATAQRYYRMQNLALSEIDSAGQNLPLYIHNLTETMSKKYKDWVNDIFGFKPEAVADGGHISLKLTDANSKHNITDKGFGYSQILPIITQLWSIVFNKNQTMRYRRTRKAIVVIEQPELHLHPRLQSMLTSAFVSIINDAKKNGFELKIIIETHSPAIVNKLGAIVAAKGINTDNITVAMFENDNDIQKVSLSHYDEEGILQDWPIGFFDF